MKKYLNKKTMLLIISILFIILGTVTLCTTGLEKSIEYKAGKRIEVYIPEGYEKQDILKIAEESFYTDEILFCKIEKINKVAGIKLAGYSEGQLENYISRIAETYEIEENEIEYDEIVVPEIPLITIVEPYILPVILITVLSLIYVIIKNYKSNGKIKMVLKTLGILVITLCLYFSIMALYELQISIYTMPIAFAIYIVTLLITVNKNANRV